MIFNGNWCIKLAYPKFKAKNTHILPWCFFTPNAIIGGVKKNGCIFQKIFQIMVWLCIMCLKVYFKDIFP